MLLLMYAVYTCHKLPMIISKYPYNTGETSQV
jgi:hypothetical protein